MKYIIMAGGSYKDKFETPKPLLKVNGEILIERTIRLLKQYGIQNIAISTNDDRYQYLGVEILRHENDYIHDLKDRHKKSKYSWLNAYYPTADPACYLPGDVYYSENAIDTIVKTKVENTMFFAVPDNQDGRKNINIKGREPLAYKVQNQKIFRKAINELFKMIDEEQFTSDPISWNLYRQINNLPLDFNGYGNDIFKTNGDFIAIDDYTTDIDSLKDITKLELLLKGGYKMIKVEVIEPFSLGKFGELKNIQRKKEEKEGYLFIGDTFECTEEMVEYLMKNNSFKRPFVKVIEIIPEEIIQPETTNIVEEPKVIEEKPKRKRKSTKK